MKQSRLDIVRTIQDAFEIIQDYEGPCAAIHYDGEEIKHMPKSVSFDNGATWYDAEEVLTNEMCKWRVYRYFDELTAAMEDDARECAHLLLFDDDDTEESKLWFVYLYLKNCKNHLVIG